MNAEKITEEIRPLNRINKIEVYPEQASTDLLSRIGVYRSILLRLEGRIPDRTLQHTRNSIINSPFDEREIVSGFALQEEARESLACRKRKR